MNEPVIFEAGMTFPILPGKREALLQFIKELAGPRRAEYEAFMTGIVKESWFLQSAPQGDLLVVYFESPDPTMFMTHLAMSEEPFDVWFREQVETISGIDLTKFFGPLPERVLHWQRE